MVTGYEANFYRQFEVLSQTMRGIESSLNIIANCMQAEELRKRRRDGGGWAPVQGNETLLGAAEQVLAEQEFTTPEDIENFGRAVQAVRRGFEDLERQVKLKAVPDEPA